MHINICMKIRIRLKNTLINRLEIHCAKEIYDKDQY